MLIMWGPEGPPPVCPQCGSFMLAKGRTECINCGGGGEGVATAARARAIAAEALVRDLRRRLGQAMAAELEAQRAAREAERAAG